MRRYDLDFLRVGAFTILILYHVGMFFVPWHYHLKNNIIYSGPELEYPMLFVNQWRLSLLFVISGMGTWFAFSKRNGKEFVKERFIRLFIPLIFGMIFIVPPQIYFERLDQGLIFNNYFDFWPIPALTSPYPKGGGISWHHLWFILYLFIFSVLLSPLFGYLYRKKDSWLIRKTDRVCSKWIGLYAFIIPLFFWQYYLAPLFPQTNSLYNDWYNLVNYCTLFFFGFLLLTVKETFWKTIVNNKYIYFICGIIGFSFIVIFKEISFEIPGKKILFAFIKVFNMWSWILTLTGFAAAYFNKPGKSLSYANEAVYPFYILHQTVIIVLGYYLKHLEWGFFTKFTLMSIGTFAITWLIYEFGIRRYNIIRPLFGMKKK